MTPQPQPIDTAPKWERILLYCQREATDEDWWEIGTTNSFGEWINDEFDPSLMLVQPTFWLPLPALPTPTTMKNCSSCIYWMTKKPIDFSTKPYNKCEKILDLIIGETSEAGVDGIPMTSANFGCVLHRYSSLIITPIEPTPTQPQRNHKPLI